jgi:hypothetical protein
MRAVSFCSWPDENTYSGGYFWHLRASGHLSVCAWKSHVYESSPTPWWFCLSKRVRHAQETQARVQTKRMEWQNRLKLHESEFEADLMLGRKPSLVCCRLRFRRVVCWSANPRAGHAPHIPGWCWSFARLRQLHHLQQSNVHPSLGELSSCLSSSVLSRSMR